jgi:peptidoglycan hydrolase CwlO-like protein
LTDTLVQLAVSASERADTHESWINSLGSQAEELAAAQVGLTTHQAKLSAHQAELSAAQVELAKAQKRTEAALVETSERLNNLTDVVERFISERRNDKS